MKLLVDDSAVRQLEKRLQNIMGLKPSSGTGSSTSSGSKENVFSNLGKLGLIAAGVGALVMAVQKIVEMVVKSSPVLQSSLKIFDTAITLILRPIGDFFGYFLRPIMLIFLTKVALPFYRLVAPLSKVLGGGAGNVLAGNWESNMEGWQLIIQGRFSELWEKARVKMEQDWGNISSGFREWAKNIILNLPLGIPIKLGIAFGDIFNKWTKDLKLPNLNGIGIMIIKWIKDIKLPTWNDLTEKLSKFFSEFKVPDIVKNAVNTFFKLLTDLANWLNKLPDFFKGWLGIKPTTTSSGNSQNMQPNLTSLTMYVNSLNPQAGGIDLGKSTEATKKWILSLIQDALKSK